MVLTGLSDRRRSCVYTGLAIAVLIALCIVVPLPGRYDNSRNSLVQHVADITKDHLPHGHKSQQAAHASGLEPVDSKYAFATFLACDAKDPKDENIDDDAYFVATRILAYQILHAPETRSRTGIPFIVLVNKAVSAAKRDRLRRDGAIIWEAEPIDGGWIVTDVSTWQSVLGKLRLWELTQFERVCFLDADTVLAKPLDGIFEDPAVQAQPVGTDPAKIRKDEGPLPSKYAFAGVPEMMHQHHYPPTEEGHDWPNYGYLNAGMFVLQPSLELLNYYLSLIETPDRFPPKLPEQNLLNYAHRPEGNMPWKHLDTKWNMHYPVVADLEGGVASLHDKWWWPVSPALSPFLLSWRWRMHGFHEARDALLGGSG